jgi:hypothetical protein
MPSKFSFLILLLFYIFSTVPASAADISIACNDLNLVHFQELDIYEINGSETLHLGTFNTTDTLTLSPDKNYQFIYKPSRASWFEDPQYALELFIRTCPPVIGFLLFLLVIAGPYYLIFRRR